MEKQKLKEKIIQRVNQIENENILKSMDILFDSSDENIAKLLTFAIEQTKNEDVSETKNYTDYIKEWVKSM